jgi:UDP-N-acetylmuramyl pentapeptide phosphotransferase/UDP-N-acetylglucosamine-1-phosphate transferase
MTVWVALFFAIGTIGTWLARAYAVQRNLLDHPGERRSHGTATPRGGGISIVLGLLVAALALAVRDPSHVVPLLGFAVALLLVAGIGWWDDHRPLPVWVRLGVHAIAAAMLAVGVFSAYGEPWLALTAFAVALALTNIWNFMDGINGIAVTQATLVAGGFAAAISDTAWGWLGWALVAACLGFLPFNFPRARIFLGDVGSGALGLAVAALAIAVVGENPMRWPVALLLPSAFLIDAGLTLGQRLVRGERW